MTDPEDRTSANGDMPVAEPDSPPPTEVTPPPGPGPVPAEGAGAPEPPPAVPSPSPPDDPTTAAGAVEAPVPAVPAPTEVELAPSTAVEPTPPTDVEPVAAARRPPPVEYEEELEADLDDDLEPIPRWVGMVNTLGIGLVAVVAAQIVTAIVQGLSYASNEPQGVEGDLLHRLGYPFAGFSWIVALVALILAVVFISLPVLLEADLTFGQERMASIGLGAIVALAVIICLGGILAVRATLNAVTASGQSVPTYFRVDRILFLLAVLGTGILAAYGALVARGLRYEHD